MTETWSWASSASHDRLLLRFCIICHPHRLGCASRKGVVGGGRIEARCAVLALSIETDARRDIGARRWRPNYSARACVSALARSS